MYKPQNLFILDYCYNVSIDIEFLHGIFCEKTSASLFNTGPPEQVCRGSIKNGKNCSVYYIYKNLYK